MQKPGESPLTLRSTPLPPFSNMLFLLKFIAVCILLVAVGAFVWALLHPVDLEGRETDFSR